jgi:hypothetical protein
LNVSDERIRMKRQDATAHLADVSDGGGARRTCSRDGRAMANGDAYAIGTAEAPLPLPLPLPGGNSAVSNSERGALRCTGMVWPSFAASPASVIIGKLRRSLARAGGRLFVCQRCALYPALSACCMTARFAAMR